MTELRHGTVHAEQRIRTLLAELPTATRNLGAEIVHSDAFRSDEWPRGQYALDRADMEAVFALLDQARSLRLARPGDAVDPSVHTPARIRAYLTARGYVRERQHAESSDWKHPDCAQPVHVLEAHFSDYPKAVGFLASDLADFLEVGELQVLKDIAEAGDA